VELEVAEGVMLLENAARLHLKNRIIVDTLTSAEDAPSPQTLDRWVRVLQDRLEAFAAESSASARRLAGERDLASTTEGVARYYHDYRHLDTDNLTRRARIAVEVARRLRAMTADPELLARLLADARALADDELSAAMRSTLAAAPRRPPEDAALVAARIEQLAAIDIPALAERAAARVGEHDRPKGLLRRALRRLVPRHRRSG
jgi:hypothetical protein